MAELVRVRTKTGVETNVSRSVAEKSSDLEILDEPAQVSFNKPRSATRTGGRRPKPHTTVAEAAGKKAVTDPADNKKEQS